MSWRDALGSDPDFGRHHLPYGVGLIEGRPRSLVRIGGYALELAPAAARLAPELAEPLEAPTLNPFLAAGPRAWRTLRTALQDWLDPARPEDDGTDEPRLHPVAGLSSRCPIEVGDYVDFYASEQHASNVGRLFRPGSAPLYPNWKHLPVAYHGRSGSVVVSGTPVRRPQGQARDESGSVVFGPSRRLDLEAEVGFVVGVGTPLGRPVAVSAFAEHVFGVGLVNDWSARDIQAWETVPLGPMLGKSFATSMSAWITPWAALDGALRPGPDQDPPPLPYLAGPAPGLDLDLEVRINGALVSRPPFASMYWTPAQLLAHLTVNGSGLRTGDLFASGTVSGPDRSQWGSLLELSDNGTRPVELPDGTRRSFLEDGDEVIVTATAHTSAGRLALGEVRGRIEPNQPATR